MTDKPTGRGGGWVIAQFALMGLIGIAAFLPPRWPEGVRGTFSVVGLVLFLGGAAFALIAARTMGRSLTPFPHPRSGSLLVDNGPFRIVRHPIYSGGILVFAGIGLATSILALVGTLVLAGVWVGKIGVEEKRLGERFVEYEAYARAVRFRIVPGLY